MTIKPNTWISVKDAIPPNKTPKGYILIGTYEDCVSELNVESYGLSSPYKQFNDNKITHWMLLSKPTEK
jgi:hypothetical protein